MQELLDEGYEFIFTRRFQNDLLENRFSQYRQMSGCRSLVSLREVLSTERILTCRPLLKQHIDFWKENLKPAQNNEKILNILVQHESEINKLFSSPDSKEVAYTISGYITNKLIKHFQCEMCSLIMVGNDSDKATDKEYFDLLSCGGLSVSSRQMAEFFFVLVFAILEYADQFIVKNHESTRRMSTEQVLGIYSPKYRFTCEKHIEKDLYLQ